MTTVRPAPISSAATAAHGGHDDACGCGHDHHHDHGHHHGHEHVGTLVRQGPKIGRNEPCPCGSGKKYKKCCLERA